MRNVLITGGAGFIGSNFIHYLLENEPGCQIINLDALTYAGNLDNLSDLSTKDGYIFEKGDICDRSLVETIFNKYAIDTVVHFAAESHVDRSILGPMPFIQTNILGTATLLEAARKYWLLDNHYSLGEVKFHHISTDEVFGSLLPGDPPFSETSPYSPNSPYAASKAASDHLVRSYFQTYGLPITISNCSNNYGPFQFPEKLIPLTIYNAKNGIPIPVYGDGMQVRDWLYVEDHCEAIYKILKKCPSGETFNIGGNNQPSNLEVIKMICSILDEVFPNSNFNPHSSLIQFISDRPGHDRRYGMDVTKIRRELGWQPSITLLGGLKKTVHWYLENELWLSRILKREEYSKWQKANYADRK